MFKSWHIGVVLGLLVGALAAAQLIVRQRVGERPIDFKIGETTLAIPEPYFLPGGGPKVAEYLEQDGKLHSSDDKEKVGFLLCAVWPSLKSCEFSVWQESQLLIHVQNKSDYASGKQAFDIFHKSRKSEISDGSYGFNKFTWLKQDFLFKRKASEPREVVMCNQIVSVPHSRCDRYVTIGPNNLVMQFSFSRRYLDEMPTIQQDVIDKLNSFRRSGPKFSGNSP